MSKYRLDRWSKFAILGAFTLCTGTAGTGCLVGPEFRAAALPAVKSGVMGIMTGLMEGLFAAIEVDDSTSSGG